MTSSRSTNRSTARRQRTRAGATPAPAAATPVVESTPATSEAAVAAEPEAPETTPAPEPVAAAAPQPADQDSPMTTEAAITPAKSQSLKDVHGVGLILAANSNRPIGVSTLAIASTYGSAGYLRPVGASTFTVVKQDENRPVIANDFAIIRTQNDAGLRPISNNLLPTVRIERDFGARPVGPNTVDPSPSELMGYLD